MSAAPMNVGASAVNKWELAGLTLLFAVVLATFVLQHQALLVAGSVICGIYGVAANRKTRVNPAHATLILVALLLFLPAFFKPYFGLTPPFYVAATIAHLLAAMAVSRHSPHTLLAAFKILFAVSVVGIAAALYVYWGVPEPLGEIIDGSSTNGIPAYLILLQVGLSLFSYIAHGRVPILSPILTGAVAFYGYGRGSLVVAALILAFSLVLNFMLAHRAGRFRQLVTYCVLIALTATLLWNAEDLAQLLNDYTKLGAGLADPNRAEIWDQYVGKIDGWTLLFGADYAGTIIETVRAGNPHIAYIRTHAFFGLPVTLAALLSPLVVLFAPKTWGSRLIACAFLTMATMRAASEPILFPTLLDFFYLAYIFAFFRHAPAYESARSAQPHLVDPTSCNP